MRSMTSSPANPDDVARPRDRASRKVLLSVLLLLCLTSAGALGTWAAFSATTTNPGNSFDSGTVIISDNDSGSAMFAVTGVVPGSTGNTCMKVSYTGSLEATIKVYAGNVSNTFSDDFTITIDKSDAGSDDFQDCTGFAGGNVTNLVTDSTVGNLPTNYAGGYTLDAAATNPTHWYIRVTYELDAGAGNGDQGKSAEFDIVFEARAN